MLTLAQVRIRLTRIPGIAWVILLASLLIVGGGLSIYAAGLTRGRASEQLARHDVARAIAADSVAVAIARQGSAGVATARAVVRRDSLARLEASRAAGRARLQARSAAARAAFSLAGDTASIVGDSVPVVLPHVVAGSIRLADSTALAAAALEDARRATDGATVELLAAKERQLAGRDTTIAAFAAHVAADSAVINDLRAATSPRLGFRAGVAAGAAAAVGVLALVSHLFR